MFDSPFASTAVVTVSYNSVSHLRAFLSSIRATESTDVTIIVADNGSADVAEARLACSEFSAVILELGNNYGYGEAVNRAVQTLPETIDSVLISNPDVEFEGGALSALKHVLDTEAQAGAVGPRVLNSDGSIYPSARELPSLRTGIGHAFLSRIWRENPWTARYLSDFSSDTRRRTAGWLSGSCLLVRRKAFTQLGGFDGAFFMYFEDVDLGYRLGKAGWVNIYEPLAVVTHTGAHSTNTESSRMITAHHKSAYLYLSRKYATWYLAPLRGILRIGLAFRAQWLARS